MKDVSISLKDVYTANFRGIRSSKWVDMSSWLTINFKDFVDRCDHQSLPKQYTVQLLHVEIIKIYDRNSSFIKACFRELIAIGKGGRHKHPNNAPVMVKGGHYRQN